MFTTKNGKQNYYVRFAHPKPQDGATRFTVCRITDDISEIVASASCSKKDNFDRAKGRKIAFTRAVNRIPDKNIRTLLWVKYFEACKR